VRPEFLKEEIAMEITKETQAANRNAGVLIIAIAFTVIAILVYCGVPIWAPIINLALVSPVVPIGMYLRKRNSAHLKRQLLVLIFVTAAVACFLTPILLRWIERGR